MYQSFDEECQSILLKTVQEKEALKDEFIGSRGPSCGRRYRWSTPWGPPG